MTTTTRRSIGAVETAKLVRRALKDAFPGQKFSVRTDQYAGGASVRVRYTDGPAERRVKAVAGQFAGGGFDGMIDLAYSVEHWLRPDGRVMLAHSPGTEGSRGSVPEIDNRDLAPVIPDDAELVHFGANFIFVDRDITDRADKAAEAEAWLRQNFHIDKGTTTQHDRLGNYWVGDLANGLAHEREFGEDWQTAWDRRY